MDSRNERRGQVPAFAEAGYQNPDTAGVEDELERLEEVAAEFEGMQEQSLKIFDEMAKQQEENERLISAIEGAIPDEAQRQQITERNMHAISRVADQQGWTQELQEDGGADAMEVELGSSPVQSMSINTPSDIARLRGGGGGGGGILSAMQLRLRGGGNVLSIGSGYTAEERTLNKKLCKVVGLGDTEAIKSLVKQGADPSYTGCSMLNFSAMHHGVHKYQMESVELLKKLGGDIHTQDQLGWTLLHQAAHNGDLEACERLVKWGLDVNIKNNAGRTAALVAKTAQPVSTGSRECYKRLMQLQAEAMPQGDAKKEMKAKADAAANEEVEDEGDDEDEEEEEEQPPVPEPSKGKKKN